MTPLQTERLLLAPLNLDQLKKLKEDEKALEQILGLTKSDARLSEAEFAEQKDAIHNWIEKVKQNPDAYQWYTNWMIISKKEYKALGAINLTRMGIQKEQLLLGYQIKMPFRRRGYAREAVKGIQQWAFSDPSLEVLIAETDKKNKPSEGVLKSTGFEFIFQQNGVNIWACQRFC